MRAVLILADNPATTLPAIHHKYGKKRGQFDHYMLNGDGRRRTPAMIKAELLKSYSKGWQCTIEPVSYPAGHSRYVFTK